jgi:hypothetical protein
VWTYEAFEEQIKSDQLKVLTQRERMLRWTLIALISILVLGAIYVGVHLVGGS